jgi:hypothetical protein
VGDNEGWGRRARLPEVSMNRNVKIGLGIAAAAAAGFAGGYYFATSRAGKKAIDVGDEVITNAGLRLPQPDYAMMVPETADEFATLDDLVCQCGAPIVARAHTEDSPELVADEIRDCVANMLYPDFPWPPMAGDHPTSEQLYTELGLIARRALATATICPDPRALPAAPESSWP